MSPVEGLGILRTGLNTAAINFALLALDMESAELADRIPDLLRDNAEPFTRLARINLGAFGLAQELMGMSDALRRKHRFDLSALLTGTGRVGLGPLLRSLNREELLYRVRRRKLHVDPAIHKRQQVTAGCPAHLGFLGVKLPSELLDGLPVRGGTGIHHLLWFFADCYRAAAGS